MKHITLRDARKRAGLTQVELAAASGVEQTVISKLEIGTNKNPSFATALKLAKALGIEAERLQFGTQDEAVA